MKNRIIFLLALLVIFQGCSKGSKSKTTLIPKNETQTPSPLEIEGQYIALFESVNEVSSGPISGALTLARDQDEFVADVRFAGGIGTANILHAQNIHVGSRCPNPNDDLNGDGYIDEVEGQAVYGKILIPLDGDLNTQHMGKGTFPVSDDFANYIWTGVASFNKFLSDLRETDINLDDNYVKLDGEKRLDLVGRVVVIQGIKDTIPLPETIMTIGFMGPQQSLPIACGVITEVAGIPGVIDHGGSTGLPIPEGGGTGGSGGADDGATLEIPDHSRRDLDRGVLNL